MAEHIGLLVSILIVACISLLLSLGLLASMPGSIDQSKLATDIGNQVGKSIIVPKAPEPQNLSSIEKGIADIKKTVNEDNDWENAAVDLATLEWNSKNYKDIFNFLNDELNNTIDDREDISSVVETNKEVTGLDVDDKDAVVVQELKVRYEDTNGDNKKVKIEVTTEIKDGEIEDQSFDLI